MGYNIGSAGLSTARQSVTATSQEMAPPVGSLARMPAMSHYSLPGYIEIFNSRSLTSPSPIDMLMTLTTHGGRFTTTRVLECFVLPIIEPDNSLLSITYTSYLDTTRRFIEGGINLNDIMDTNFVAVDLLFRERLPSDPWSISFWACELVKSFNDHDIFVLLAAIFMYTHLIRVCQSATHKCAHAANERPTVASRPYTRNVCPST